MLLVGVCASRSRKGWLLRRVTRDSIGMSPDGAANAAVMSKRLVSKETKAIANVGMALSEMRETCNIGGERVCDYIPGDAILTSFGEAPYHFRGSLQSCQHEIAISYNNT
jgi:hypothetical protein